MGIGTHRRIGRANTPLWIVGARHHSSMREFRKNRELRRHLNTKTAPMWLAVIAASNARHGDLWGLKVTEVRRPHASQLAWNSSPRRSR